MPNSVNWNIDSEYINVMQHDMPIHKAFPVLEVIQAMPSCPEIKLVRYTRISMNSGHNPMLILQLLATAWYHIQSLSSME